MCSLNIFAIVDWGVGAGDATVSRSEIYYVGFRSRGWKFLLAIGQCLTTSDKPASNFKLDQFHCAWNKYCKFQLTKSYAKHMHTGRSKTYWQILYEISHSGLWTKKNLYNFSFLQQTFVLFLMYILNQLSVRVFVCCVNHALVELPWLALNCIDHVACYTASSDLEGVLWPCAVGRGGR